MTADGRSRAYAWGRSVAREDVVAATERLLVLSGQFAQRRLARPSHQLDLLDAFVGPDQRSRRIDARDAWRTLQAAERRVEELERGADAERARLAELEALVEDTDDLTAGEEDALRAERERFRHVAELGEGASAAVAAIDPDEGEGARALAASAERALAPLERLAPELGAAATELRTSPFASVRWRATCTGSRTDWTPIRRGSAQWRSGSTGSPTCVVDIGRPRSTSCS